MDNLIFLTNIYFQSKLMEYHTNDLLHNPIHHYHHLHKYGKKIYSMGNLKFQTNIFLLLVFHLYREFQLVIEMDLPLIHNGVMDIHNSLVYYSFLDQHYILPAYNLLYQDLDKYS
eukprot:jgi/Orpsp1_1/1189304/evm.model.d7180000070995.1